MRAPADHDDRSGLAMASVSAGIGAELVVPRSVLIILTARAPSGCRAAGRSSKNDSLPIVAPPEPPSFPDLSSRRETANNVEAIDTAAPVRGFEFAADF